jgi:putative transposon-encoded protein
MRSDKNRREPAEGFTGENWTAKTKFEVYGQEMIEKQVRSSGNSGRVYLPPEWVGLTVKVIRID